MTLQTTSVPRSVIGALLEVQRSIRLDLTDRETAIMFVAVTGHPDEAEWLSTHRDLYLAVLDASRTG